MFLVTADPTTAFADAIKTILSADAALSALVEGVFGHVSETAAQDYPYVVLSRTSADGNAGAMGIAGHLVSLQVDAWSNAKGPYEGGIDRLAHPRAARAAYGLSRVWVHARRRVPPSGIRRSVRRAGRGQTGRAVVPIDAALDGGTP
jgi:hypothetical protein